MEWALSAACFAAYLLGLSQFICRALIHRKAAFQFCQKCASEMRRAFRQASPQEKHLRRQVVLLKSSRAITHATCWLAVMTFSLQSIVFNIAMEQTRWMSDQATWGQVILTVILMVIVQVSSAMNEHTLDMWYIFCQLLSALLTSSYSCSTDQALTASMFVFLFISGPAAMFANRRILIFVSHLGLFGLAVLRCLTEDFPVGMRGGPAYAMTFFMFLCVASVISQFSHHQCRREVEAGVREKNSATQLSAASELLQLTCDAVLELDHDLRLRVHSSQLATMLLHRPHASLKGMKFTKFIAQAEGDRCTSLLEEATGCGVGEVSAQAFHTHLVDSCSSRFRTEVFQVKYCMADGQMCHLIGLRDFTDLKSLARSATDAIEDEDDASIMDASLPSLSDVSAQSAYSISFQRSPRRSQSPPRHSLGNCPVPLPTHRAAEDARRNSNPTLDLKQKYLFLELDVESCKVFAASGSFSRLAGLELGQVFRTQYVVQLCTQLCQKSENREPLPDQTVTFEKLPMLSPDGQNVEVTGTMQVLRTHSGQLHVLLCFRRPFLKASNASASNEGRKARL